VKPARKRRCTSLTCRTAAVCAVVLLVFALWNLVVPAGAGPPLTITIPRGSSAWQIAQMLGEKHVVRSPASTAAAAYLSGKWRRLRAGRHEVAPSMTPLEILALLSRDANDCWTWLTVPEGYTLRQIAQAIETAGLGKEESVLRQAQEGGRVSTPFPLPETGLEGYLFPDTYRVDAAEQEADVLNQMLRRFDEVVWQGLFHGQPTYQGRTLNEIIILASLVEAEAKQPKDRPTIAGVLMNRLRTGRRLECDATVQYALGDGRKPRLMQADTQVESPYNTYLHAGLPPGPICNPGEASIRAAMDPADVPYLYYVARPDGSHVFSRTLEEHQAAIARIRSGS